MASSIPQKRHDIIVVGASAGGVGPLVRLVRALPAAFPASLFVVVHVAEDAESPLAHILARAGFLPARQVERWETIEVGQIYVAPPGMHLGIADGQVFPQAGPRENGHRPAIDPLLRSAARAYGSRVIAVILSGIGSDGSRGLRAVKEQGGQALVQHPEEALQREMPLAAIASVKADGVAPVLDLVRTLRMLVAGRAPLLDPRAPSRHDKPHLFGAHTRS